MTDAAWRTITLLVPAEIARYLDHAYNDVCRTTPKGARPPAYTDFVGNEYLLTLIGLGLKAVQVAAERPRPSACEDQSDGAGTDAVRPMKSGDDTPKETSCLQP